MATTTNYGWTTPDDTALVKDGASAIRSLGTAVDTTTKNLNPSTTLGDIEYRSSTANTNTRLPIGSTGNVLTVAAGVPSWAAPAAGGGLTLLSTTTLSGAQTVISSISGSYKNLYVVLSDVAASGTFGLRFFTNSASGNCYGRVVQVPNSSGTVSTLNSASMGGVNNFSLTANTDNAAADVFDGTIEIAHYASTSGKRKKINTNFLSFQNGYYTAHLGSYVYYSSTTAISSLTFEVNTGTFSGGTVLVYGVN